MAHDAYIVRRVVDLLTGDNAIFYLRRSPAHDYEWVEELWLATLFESEAGALRFLRRCHIKKEYHSDFISKVIVSDQQ